MSFRQYVLEAIAVVAGLIIGAIALDIVTWLFAGGRFLGILTSPGWLVILLVAVGLFAVFYRSMPPTAAAIAAFFTGVGLPALAAKLAFGATTSWGAVLFVYVVFALVALFTYRFVHANAVVRGVASDIAGSDEGPGSGR